MDRYAIALNKKPVNTSMKGMPVAEEYVGPACHYECKSKTGSWCRTRSPNGFYCGRLFGHKGPHVACIGCADRHELDIWEVSSEDVSAGEGPYR